MAQKKRSSQKTVRSVRPAPSTIMPLAQLSAFFAQRKNLIKILVIVVLFGLAYLFKDVLIVAVVNGKPIYRWTVVAQLEKQGGQPVLDSLVTETLVRQAIKEAGVKINQADIDAQLAEIEARLSAQSLTLDQALVQEGLTRQDLIDDITLQRSAEQLVVDRVTITEAEIDTYIADNAAYLPAELEGEALRTSVREQLSAAKLSEAIGAWVEELRAKAQIIYLKEYQTKPL